MRRDPSRGSNPDGGDLPSRLSSNPDPGASGKSRRDDLQRGKEGQDSFFHLPQIKVQVALFRASNVKDRITDELTWLMEGDVPAPVRPANGDSPGQNVLLAEEQVSLAAGGAPGAGRAIGDCRLMLEKPKEVRELTSLTLPDELFLRFLSLTVSDGLLPSSRFFGSVGRAQAHDHL